MLKENAINNFKSGYSCSESIVKAAINAGYCSEETLKVASAFSGGMGVRCLCGAVAGAQIVIGSLYGKDNNQNGMKSREYAKLFAEKFAEKYKVNCCKVLSGKFEFGSPERKENCTKIVETSAEILQDIILNNNN